MWNLKRLRYILSCLVIATIGTLLLLKRSDSDILHEIRIKMNLNAAAKNNVDILCWVAMKPDEEEKAVAVMDTWGKRCSTFLFFSSKNVIGKLPVVKTLDPAEETYEKLWGKTRKALNYLWDHHNTSNWFWKADTNSYTIIENLKYLIADLDPSEPHYMGFRYRKPFGHVSGSGYLLSRTALQLVVENGFRSRSNPCESLDTDEGTEDLKLYACIRHVGVDAEDTRDVEGKHRFFPIKFEKHLMPKLLPPIFWNQPYYPYPRKKFPACCSDVSINFHEVSPSQMYLMEFFLYHLRVKGLRREDKEYNVKSLKRRILSLFQ